MLTGGRRDTAPSARKAVARGSGRRKQRKAKSNFAGPGRQPGNFLFKAEKKVTKETALHLQWAAAGYWQLAELERAICGDFCELFRSCERVVVVRPDEPLFNRALRGCCLKGKNLKPEDRQTSDFDFDFD